MSRFSHYDTDEERLPDGMRRVGYDADTQVYTFQDTDGSYWESAPGCEYGHLGRVGGGYSADATDDEPFLAQDGAATQRPSWRADMMPLLNFGMLICLCLLGLFWYLHYMASEDNHSLEVACASGSSRHRIKQGDSCWEIGKTWGIGVKDVLELNKGLDCSNLDAGSMLCLPEQVMAVPSTA